MSNIFDEKEYVSFETSKLLHRGGWNIATDRFYDEKGNCSGRIYVEDQ